MNPQSLSPRLVMRTAFAACATFATSLALQAQVLYTTENSVYTQNFDSMSISSGTATLPTGWSVGTNTSGPGGTTSTVNLYNTTTSTLSSTGGATSYSFQTTDGVTPSGDLSLGSITGVAPYLTQLRITNNTGITLTSFTISYTGEQWRQAGAAETLLFYYGVGTQIQANMTAAGSSFNFTTPQTGSTSALNGNLAANQVTGLGGTITGLNWTAGTTLYLRWYDPGTNDSGNASALAIDNFTFSATAVPEPATTSLLVLSLATILFFQRRRTVC